VKLARLLLAAAFLLATQVALVQPFAHVGPHSTAQSATVWAGEQHRADLSHAQQCDVCTAAEGLGAFALSSIPSYSADQDGQLGVSSAAQVHLAAFSPLFRSQAPPALS